MRTLALLASMILAGQTQSNPYWRLPATIETLRDVKVGGPGPYERGKLGVDSDEFVIKKGDRFQMVEIHGEGGCRIRVNQTSYDLGSCPWLEGFRDSQADIFKVVSGHLAGAETVLVWNYGVVSTPDLNRPFRHDLPGFEGPVALNVNRPRRVQGIQMHAIYEAIVDTDGRTRVDRAVSVSSTQADPLARQIIESWRFQPARFDGKSIRVRLRIEISQANIEARVGR